MNGRRPPLAAGLAVAFAASAVAMALIGMSASAYYVPSAVLLGLAALQWFGAGLAWMRGVLWCNLGTGSVLIVVLAVGDALGLPKLDIAGAMLVGNLLSGGPLGAVCAVPWLLIAARSQTMRAWFGAAHD